MPYILFEIPGNLLIARFRPRLLRESSWSPMFLNSWGANPLFFPVPGCVFLFGCITIAQGFVKSWSGLLATRFLLGSVEACVSPGCYYIIVMHVFCLPYHTSSLTFSIRWYKRSEAQKRFTIFFGATSLAGAFGGLLAYAISRLDGKAGLADWRWVFVVGVSIFPPLRPSTRLTSRLQRVS